MTDQLRSADLPPDVPQPVRPVGQSDSEFRFWWYCLSDNHPGTPSYSAQPLDLRRIFGTNTDRGCPTCPGCQREVSAIPCAGPNMPPVEVVDYHKVFAQQQLTGGIGR